MTFTRWTDSLGHVHQIPCDLLAKGGLAGIVRQPATEDAFRLLVDELRAFRERRRRMAAKVRAVPTNTRDPKAEKEAERIAAADHLPTVRQRPAVRKSFSAMAAELSALAAEAQRQTERIQQQRAIAMLDNLASAARAGKLGSIEAAKVDALRHRHATNLGLTATGIRS